MVSYKEWTTKDPNDDNIIALTNLTTDLEKDKTSIFEKGEVQRRNRAQTRTNTKERDLINSYVQ